MSIIFCNKSYVNMVSFSLKIPYWTVFPLLVMMGADKMPL